MINDVVNMSEAEIISEIDAGDRGLGSYMAEISVEAVAGNTPSPVGCSRTDIGEQVIYKLELIIFEYEIVELEEPKEPEEPDEAAE